jgi:hypothetical protein
MQYRGNFFFTFYNDKCCKNVDVVSMQDMNAGRRRKAMHIPLPPDFFFFWEKFEIEEKGYICTK